MCKFTTDGFNYECVDLDPDPTLNRMAVETTT